MRKRTAGETAAYLEGYEAGRQVKRPAAPRPEDERETPPSVSDERGRRSDASGVAGVPASVTERERFEAWVCKMDTQTYNYATASTLMWLAWQARAAMAPPPPHFMGQAALEQPMTWGHKPGCPRLSAAGDPPCTCVGHGQPLPSLSGQPQWRPIESAPRDEVLCTLRDVNGLWHTEVCDDSEYRREFGFTHWMPLPAPPPTYDTQDQGAGAPPTMTKQKADTGERTP